MQPYPSTPTTQRQRIMRAHLLRVFLRFTLVLLAAFASFSTAARAEMTLEEQRAAALARPPQPPITPMATPAEAPATSAHTVALLLPLSGPDSVTGKAMLDAATLALYDMQRNKPLDRPVPVVRLLPKDTKSDPAVAQQIVRDLLDKPDSKPTAILGPLFSRELEVVLPLVRDANVPLITFSNNPALGNRGAYQFNYMASEQAERLADYAMSQGVQSVASIAAADGYGRQVMDQLGKALKTRGITYGPTVLLPPGLLLAPDALAEMIPALKSRRTQRSLLFVAEQRPRLDSIVIALAKARVLNPNLVLAGTGVWDDPAQLATPALTNAIFVSTPRKEYELFARKYQTTYGSYPPRIASIAYDAVALVTSQLYYGGAASLSDQALQHADGFITPANGLVRFGANGMAQRRLAVYLATGMGSAKVLEDAPKKFE